MWLPLGEFVCEESNCRLAGLQNEICWLMSFMCTSTFWKPKSAQMFLEMVHNRETDFWQQYKEILKRIIVPEVWEFMASLCTGNLNVNWYLYQFPFWGSLSLMLTFFFTCFAVLVTLVYDEISWMWSSKLSYYGRVS